MFLSRRFFFHVPCDPVSKHIFFTLVEGFLKLFLLSIQHLPLMFNARSHFIFLSRCNGVRILRMYLRVCAFCPCPSYLSFQVVVHGGVRGLNVALSVRDKKSCFTRDSRGREAFPFGCFSWVPQNRSFVLRHCHCHIHSCHLATLDLPFLCTVSRSSRSSFPSPAPSTPSRLQRQVSPFHRSSPRDPRLCVASGGIFFSVPFRFSSTPLSTRAATRIGDPSMIRSSPPPVLPFAVCLLSIWLLAAARLLSSASSVPFRTLHLLLALVGLFVCPATAFSILWLPPSTRATSSFPLERFVCKVLVITSRGIFHTSSEHDVYSAFFHLSSGTSFANSSRQSKNSCLFSPFFGASHEL